MKSITLPFLFFALLSNLCFAGRAKSLKLKGRVPASVQVIKNKDKDSKQVIKSNIDKQSYTIKEVQKDNHKVFEISFH
ncbi:hypothetical protein [Halobacteriovorax sp.]|uniref:hypothetical protein n=1 Tax=Halobacteriovorax sp. TaxID=2020862 RepID=UPI003AF21AA5